jgi:hypothetical protein
MNSGHVSEGAMAAMLKIKLIMNSIRSFAFSAMSASLSS